MNDTPETDDTWDSDLRNKCQKFERERYRLAEALRIIADGTSCRECGGEDQALLAREALQSLTDVK
jgi:hypothetical protein